MLDLLIRNGSINDGVGTFRGSLGVAGSRIVGRYAEGAALPEAEQTIDATDRLVLPGIVDPHVHFYGEGIGGYSRLAAMGGVTTFIGMIRGEPDEPLADVVNRHVAEGVQNSLVDFSFHVVLHDRPQILGQIAGLQDLGFNSFKMFLAYKRRGMMANDAFLFAAMEEINRCGGIALVHSENGELVDRLEQAAMTTGRKRREDYAPTRPPEAEAAAIDLVALGAQATGCSAYIVHVSSAEGLAAVERARHRGVRLWAETCPQYILMTDETLRRHGPMARIAPPLRSDADCRALGTALATGSINTVGSDHASYGKEAKAQGDDDIFQTPFGMPGAPTLWPSMFTWAQSQGIPLTSLVRAMTCEPARIFGLDHCKGSLAPGADADIVLIDPKTYKTVDGAALWPGLCPSPLDGTPLTGWPTMTISRGKVVWAEDSITAKPGRGRQVKQERAENA